VAAGQTEQAKPAKGRADLRAPAQPDPPDIIALGFNPAERAAPKQKNSETSP